MASTRGLVRPRTQRKSTRRLVVAVTRPESAVAATEALLRAQGWRPLVVPVFRLRPLLSVTKFRRILRELELRPPRCAIFMSQTAVEVLADVAARSRGIAKLRTVLGRAVLLAVGPTTQQALQRRLSLIAQVPAHYTSTGLVETVAGLPSRPTNVVVFRSAAGSPTLARALHALGCRVQEYRVYGAEPNPHGPRKFARALARGDVDALVVTSALGARLLLDGVSGYLGQKLAQRLINQTRLVAIGPESARQLAKLGLHVRAVPGRHLLKEAVLLVAEKLPGGKSDGA